MLMTVMVMRMMLVMVMFMVVIARGRGADDHELRRCSAGCVIGVPRLSGSRLAKARGLLRSEHRILRRRSRRESDARNAGGNRSSFNFESSHSNVEGVIPRSVKAPTVMSPLIPEKQSR